MGQVLDTLKLLGSAGVHYTPQPGTVPAGVNKRGLSVHFAKDIANSTDSSAGPNRIKGVQLLLHPTGALSTDDHESLNKLSDAVGNQKLIKELDGHADKGDREAFSSTALTALKSNDSVALSARALADNWPKMSPAQKSVGLAGLGLQGHTFADGKNIYNKCVVPKGKNLPELTTGKSLDLMGKGVNIYPLSKNWAQHTTLEKLAGGHDEPDEIAQFAYNNDLLGHGINGAEVPVDDKALSTFKQAPQYGVGAIVGPLNSPIPQGYKVAHQSAKGVVAAPSGTIGTALGAVSNLDTAGGKDGVSDSAASVYKSWGDKRKERPAVGGSALLSGLTKMSSTNPYVFSGNVGVSTFKNTGIPQSSASYLKQAAGISLSRLLSGEVSGEVDKKGSDLVKGAKDAKSLYAKHGITSKGDAYQLANQGYAEGKFTESELTGMHQAFNLVFDPLNEKQVQKILVGKDRAKELIDSIPNSQKPASGTTDYRARNAAKYGGASGV